MEDYVEKLELALAGIDGAIGELLSVDGMEDYVEKLGEVAANIEMELDELRSLEGK